VTDTTVTQIAIQSILLATKLAGPVLLVSLLIGLGVGLVQSATQIQEQTLAFVPKLVGIALVIVLAGNWMLSQVISFTQNLFNMVPALIR
jgi:flagellar biosynthesis protein FliQ